jgi:hypothetical protein
MGWGRFLRGPRKSILSTPLSQRFVYSYVTVWKISLKVHHQCTFTRHSLIMCSFCYTLKNKELLLYSSALIWKCCINFIELVYKYVLYTVLEDWVEHEELIILCQNNDRNAVSEICCKKSECKVINVGIHTRHHQDMQKYGGNIPWILSLVLRHWCWEL